MHCQVSLLYCNTRLSLCTFENKLISCFCAEFIQKATAAITNPLVCQTTQPGKIPNTAISIYPEEVQQTGRRPHDPTVDKEALSNDEQKRIEEKAEIADAEEKEERFWNDYTSA